MYERVEAPHKTPVEKLFKNCHIKNEFGLILRNEKKQKTNKNKRKRKKYTPDGNIFVSKFKY